MRSIPARFLFLLVLCLWLSARMLPVHDFVTERRLVGPDSYYHLRHAQAVKAHFPHLARYDVGTHYPRGERGFNQGLHDLVLALVDATCGAPWYGWLTGAVLLLLLFFLVRGRAGEWAGVAAAALMLAYPGHLRIYAGLGNCDHHSTEVLLALAVVGGLWLEGRWAWLSGLPLALFFFTWYGAPLHLALAGLSLMLGLALHPRPLDQLKSLMGGFWLCFGPLWLLAPAYRVHPQGFALALAGTVAGLLLLSLVQKLGTRALWLPPAILVGISQTSTGRRLFELRDTSIAEHQATDLAGLWFAFGPLLWIFLALAAVHYYQAFRGNRDLPETVAWSYGLALVLLWCHTRDFAYYAAPFLALGCALEGSRWKAAGPIKVGALLLLLMVPVLPSGVERPWLIPQIARTELVALSPGLDQALTFLKDQTPPPQVPTTAVVPPFTDFDYGAGTYGVVCDWSLGHLVSALGRRPPIFSETVNGELAQKLLTTQEEELLRYLKSKCKGEERFRYMLLTADDVATRFAGRVQQAGGDLSHYRDQVARVDSERGVVEFPCYGPGYDNIFIHRLYLDPDFESPHFRPVFASEQQQTIADMIQFSAAGADVFRTALNLDPARLPPGREAVSFPGGILYHPRGVPAARIWEIVDE